MRLKVLENFTREEDIQIQSACAKIGFDLTLGANPFNGGASAVYIRLRHISTLGTRVLRDRMNLVHALEIDNYSEGTFEVTQVAADQWQLTGTIVVGEDGALDLVGGYLTLSIDSGTEIQLCIVEAIDGDGLTRSYRRLNTFVVNGLTQDIDITQARALAIRPYLVDAVQIQKNGRPYEHSGSELLKLAADHNDIVCVDKQAGTAVFGVKNFMVLDVRASNTARITPANGAGQFEQYLLQTETF